MKNNKKYFFKIMFLGFCTEEFVIRLIVFFIRNTILSFLHSQRYEVVVHLIRQFVFEQY